MYNLVPDGLNHESYLPLNGIECMGNCLTGYDGHKGQCKLVNVSHNGHDWGDFVYCENAIEEDTKRGMKIVFIEDQHD